MAESAKRWRDRSAPPVPRISAKVEIARSALSGKSAERASRSRSARNRWLKFSWARCCAVGTRCTAPNGAASFTNCAHFNSSKIRAHGSPGPACDRTAAVVQF
eukprot:1387489-Pyramimonas_sp.AAC.1